MHRRTPIPDPRARGLPFERVKETLAPRGQKISDRRAAWHASGGRCFWCDHPMLFSASPGHPRSLTIDHAHTRASGLYRDSPKVGACFECNSERGDMTALQYWSLWSQRLAMRAAQ